MTNAWKKHYYTKFANDLQSPAKTVQRVSVPFPEAQLRYRGKAKYGTGQKEPLTRRRSASNREMDEF
jgi:hypothetical protein